MTGFVCEIEDIPLSAGVPGVINRTGSYFIIVSGSDVDVTFFHKGTRIGGFVGMQGGDAVGPLSRDYDKVEMASATGQTVKYGTTSDPVTITRLSGDVNATISGVVTTAAGDPGTFNELRFKADLILQTAAVTSIWGTDANDRERIITSHPDNTAEIRLGHASASLDGDRGMLLMPGQTAIIRANAAMFAYTGVAGQKLCLAHITI